MSLAPMARDATARNAGRMLMRTMVRKVCSPNCDASPPIHQTAAQAMPMPRTAPAESAARWKPKANPLFSGGMLSAMRASRGAFRIPFPMRSTKRTAPTAVQLEAM